MMKLKVLMLDFDGIVLESNAIKDEAFKHVFADCHASLNAIMGYHKQSQGKIRFEKFKHIYTHILNKDYTPEVEHQLATAFSRYALSALAVCPFVEGAKEFLDFWHTQVPMYVVSINPPEDLAHVLEVRNLNHYFKEVYATTDKVGAINQILAKEGIAREETVFVGDAMTDYQAATTCGVSFVGRNSGSFDGVNDFPVFSNMHLVKEWLCQNAA